MTQSINERLKSFIKDRPLLHKYVKKYLANAIFKKPYVKSIKGKNNVIKKERTSLFINCKFVVKGNNNRIIIHESCFFKNVTFYIKGNNNLIHIANNVGFNRSGEIWVEDYNCEVKIGSNSTFEEVHLAATEPYSKIIIGNDCMFSTGIDVRTGDSHSILDMVTGQRINKSKNIEIADHVWVGAYVSILKGAEILKNSIVATRSVVTKPMKKENIIIGGTPAKILRESVTWCRERL